MPTAISANSWRIGAGAASNTAENLAEVTDVPEPGVMQATPGDALPGRAVVTA
ncbi:hypothetical protein [Rhodococcoides corynebacterioides]|uniref:hypothetical protein n=1 Tax=Rhodococcoides corynebacterioides TaxID=53972 RepID=UPI001C9A8CAA|nr:hypothetical protein [Rhodococcus corynebacterioides]MBY6349705.1 hypothetical protein [Rhodococcus corynebacterioides]MBY6363491.1 hypothetical protein [Rhodococcus corynebacterioides]